MMICNDDKSMEHVFRGAIHIYRKDAFCLTNAHIAAHTWRQAGGSRAAISKSKAAAISDQYT